MEPSGKERRLKPRFGASLPCSVALAEEERDLLFPNEKLDCRTRDLSESGVGLVANSIYLGYTCILDEGRALAVSVELPAGTVSMEATPAHYLRLDSGGEEASYLIGLRITSMSEEHRALYLAQLEALSRSESEQS
jgi:PilZ domain